MKSPLLLATCALLLLTGCQSAKVAPSAPAAKPAPAPNLPATAREALAQVMRAAQAGREEDGMRLCTPTTRDLLRRDVAWRNTFFGRLTQGGKMTGWKVMSEEDHADAVVFVIEQQMPDRDVPLNTSVAVYRTADGWAVECV